MGTFELVVDIPFDQAEDDGFKLKPTQYGFLMLGDEGHRLD